jgi:hypothetical protein
MSTTQQDVRDFAQFAERQLSSGRELPIDELFDMWRAAHPPADELAESVAAVKAALGDMEAGDKGVAVGEHLAGLRDRFGFLQGK